MQGTGVPSVLWWVERGWGHDSPLSMHALSCCPSSSAPSPCHLEPPPPHPLLAAHPAHEHNPCAGIVHGDLKPVGDRQLHSLPEPGPVARPPNKLLPRCPCMHAAVNACGHAASGAWVPSWSTSHIRLDSVVHMPCPAEQRADGEQQGRHTWLQGQGGSGQPGHVDGHDACVHADTVCSHGWQPCTTTTPQQGTSATTWIRHLLLELHHRILACSTGPCPLACALSLYLAPPQLQAMNAHACPPTTPLLPCLYVRSSQTLGWPPLSTAPCRRAAGPGAPSRKQALPGASGAHQGACSRMHAPLLSAVWLPRPSVFACPRTVGHTPSL